MNRNNCKKNKNNQEKEKNKVCEGRKKKGNKEMGFKIKKKLHPTNETHNRFHQTGALVGVGSF
jgi:hypothetical protein